MNELRCGFCHEWRPIDQFPIDLTKSRGRRQLCSTCKPLSAPKVMPKPLYNQRVTFAMCGKKARFKSKSKALIVALRDSRRTRFMRVYKCPICKGWHVTHKAELVKP